MTLRSCIRRALAAPVIVPVLAYPLPRVKRDPPSADSAGNEGKGWGSDAIPAPSCLSSFGAGLRLARWVGLRRAHALLTARVCDLHLPRGERTGRDRAGVRDVRGWMGVDALGIGRDGGRVDSG
jgi:hypothetical protein